MRKMRKMRNCAQLIFVARKMRKFAPTRKPDALETLLQIKVWEVAEWPDRILIGLKICSQSMRRRILLQGSSQQIFRVYKPAHPLCK